MSSDREDEEDLELRALDRHCERYAARVRDKRCPLPVGLARLAETTHDADQRVALAEEMRRAGQDPLCEAALLKHLCKLVAFVEHAEHRARRGRLVLVAPLIVPVHSECRNEWLPLLRRLVENGHLCAAEGLVARPAGLLAVAASVYWAVHVRLARLVRLDDAEQPAGTERRLLGDALWAKMQQPVLDFQCVRVVCAPAESIGSADAPASSSSGGGGVARAIPGEEWRRYVPRARTVAHDVASALLCVPLASVRSIGQYTLGEVDKSLRAIGGLFHDTGRHGDVETLFSCLLLRLADLLQEAADGEGEDTEEEITRVLADGPCPIRESRLAVDPLLTAARGTQRIVLLERVAAMAEPWQLRCVAARQFDRVAQPSLCPLGPFVVERRSVHHAGHQAVDPLAAARRHVDAWPPLTVLGELAKRVEGACADTLLGGFVLEKVRDGAAGRLLRPGERQLQRTMRSTDAERQLLLALIDGGDAVGANGQNSDALGQVHESLIVEAALSKDRALGGTSHAEDVLDEVRNDGYLRRLQPVSKVAVHALLLAYAEEVRAAALTLAYTPADDDGDDYGDDGMDVDLPQPGTLAHRRHVASAYSEEERRLYVEWSVCPHERLSLLAVESVIDTILTSVCGDDVVPTGWRVRAALFPDDQRDLASYFPPDRPDAFFQQRAAVRQRGPVMAVLVRDWYVVEWSGDNDAAAASPAGQQQQQQRRRKRQRRGDPANAAMRCWAFGPHPLSALGALLGVAERQGVLPLPAIQTKLAKEGRVMQSFFFQPPFVHDPAAQ